MPDNKTKDPDKKLGRPKKSTVTADTVGEIVDEKLTERLDMDQKEKATRVTVEEVTNEWRKTFVNMSSLDGVPGIGTVAAKWNKLNPFLQNQRIKNLYTRAKEYSKVDISGFLSDPANHERELRALSWANSSTQQIYYNILRRSADIPNYNYFVVPPFLDQESNYKKDDFEAEDGLVQNWLETFNIPTTFKTIAMEVKREGKSTYLLRNKFVGSGKNKKTAFCTLQKMPTDWIKITGKGQLGYTVSFDMLYFLDIANSPNDFGDFMIKAWADLVENGVVYQGENNAKWDFDVNKAKNYTFAYNGQNYPSAIELIKKGRQVSYLFWLRLPYDLFYTFGSDNSHPWVAPDTMGLMLKLQELTDYGQLAGLIASTPLTAVLTGEIETINDPRAGKNEAVFSAEVLKGYMDQFNAATSTNVEAWLWPAKNIKLQQLASDVNSSEIITTATENFVESSGDAGLTITDSKPNVMMVKTAQLLGASQQRYVTLQFEQVINFILQYKLDMKYEWKVRIWGDIFSNESEKKYLKEIVANGNTALFPKLMSAEGISMRDTKAIINYLKTLDFYKEFKTYTQEAQLNAQLEKESRAGENAPGTVGRPELADSEIESDATAASREAGTNTSDNRA